jgi:hypothetical protein
MRGVDAQATIGVMAALLMVACASGGDPGFESRPCR